MINWIILILPYVFVGTVISKIVERITNKWCNWDTDPDEVLILTFCWPLFLINWTIYYGFLGFLNIINPIADKCVDGICKIVNKDKKKDCDKNDN